jgi:hypothetical protein
MALCLLICPSRWSGSSQHRSQHEAPCGQGLQAWAGRLLKFPPCEERLDLTHLLSFPRSLLLSSMCFSSNHSIRKLSDACGKEWDAHWQCLENRNQEFYPCRKIEKPLNQCVFQKMVSWVALVFASRLWSAP